MAKVMTISRDEQAARLVRLMIEAGLVLASPGLHGTFTAGPYTKAVGPSTFALFGYGRYGQQAPADYQAREGSALDVARAFVSCVGSTRAREVALRAPGRPPASDAPARIARERAEHVRSCRAIRCKTCGA